MPSVSDASPGGGQGEIPHFVRDDNLSLSFRGVLSEAKDAEESHEGIPRFARDDKKEGSG